MQSTPARAQTNGYYGHHQPLHHYHREQLRAAAAVAGHGHAVVDEAGGCGARSAQLQDGLRLRQSDGDAAHARRPAPPARGEWRQWRWSSWRQRERHALRRDVHQRDLDRARQRAQGDLLGQLSRAGGESGLSVLVGPQGEARLPQRLQGRAPGRLDPSRRRHHHHHQTSSSSPSKAAKTSETSGGARADSGDADDGRRALQARRAQQTCARVRVQEAGQVPGRVVREGGATRRRLHLDVQRLVHALCLHGPLRRAQQGAAHGH